jgi:hypothetical protein
MVEVNSEKIKRRLIFPEFFKRSHIDVLPPNGGDKYELFGSFHHANMLLKFQFFGFPLEIGPLSVECVGVPQKSGDQGRELVCDSPLRVEGQRQILDIGQEIGSFSQAFEFSVGHGPSLHGLLPGELLFGYSLDLLHIYQEVFKTVGVYLVLE